MSDDRQKRSTAQQKSNSANGEEKSSLLSNKSGRPVKMKYPNSVFFIIGNEFCERFSFYGMRAILIVYLTDRLKYSDSQATAVYHAFVGLAYFMPLFGAILADGILGKYKTILYVSIVYLAGNFVMTFTSIPPAPDTAGPIIGLIVIAIGTGGIKPCVSAFVGDQFTSDQQGQLNRFLSMFYFAINLGSFSSMIVTPVVRANTHCFGSNCYMLAFGIPALLMLIAIAVFVVGRPYYIINPPSGSVIQKMIGCIWYALVKKRSSRDGVTKGHWLDHAEDKYDVVFRNEIRSVLHLLMVFIPLPMYFALFDQQGSSWTLQSTKMDLRIALNSLLILIFIPLFEFFIYPLAEKTHLNLRPMRRMAVGMSLAAMSFVIAGVLQIAIEWTLIDLPMPSASTSRVHVINASPCAVEISGQIGRMRLGQSQVTNASIADSGRHEVSASTTCSKPRPVKPLQSVVQLQQAKTYFYLVAERDEALDGLLVEFPSEKSKLGGSFICFVVVEMKAADRFVISLKRNGRNALLFKTASFSVPSCQQVDPGRYNVYVAVNDSPPMKLDDISYIGTGAVYAVVLRPFAPLNQREELNDAIRLQFDIYTLVHRNVISVLYQIPQYVILTVGEILFAITGIGFAYSQAPDSMKSVIQAALLLTTAVGNLIDVVVTGIHFLNQVAEFFLFAVLMVMSTLVFSAMAYNYSDLANDGSQTSERSKMSTSQTSAIK